MRLPLYWFPHSTLWACLKSNLFVYVLGQCGELSDFLEDFSFLGTSRERGEHLEGRRRRQALPRRAGEVPDHGRIQKEAKRFPQVKKPIVIYFRLSPKVLLKVWFESRIVRYIGNVQIWHYYIIREKERN